MFVVDTSVLSSFAAAKGLELLLTALSAEKLYIPPAVQQEIQTGLERGVVHLQVILDMLETDAIRVLDIEPIDQQNMAALPSDFGAGEREAVVLCQRYGATLLCNDRKVQRYCTQHSIPCLDLARLLRLLWLKGVATRAKVKTMILRMEKVEHLVFKDRDLVFAPPKNGPD
jgi:predicted nucleic acid-binding protein